VKRQIHVIAGPHRVAKRYAQSRGLPEDEFVIVSRAHQLAKLDPALILRIITVKLDALGERVRDEIEREIASMSVLWPVPTHAAA
jgi:hypothetical protein